MAVQAFQALGTWVDLLTQTFSVPPDTVRRILDADERLATGPVLVPVRTVARLKGLLGSTWLSTGVATRVRTRLLAAVVDSRPPARSPGLARRRDPHVGSAGRSPLVGVVPPPPQWSAAAYQVPALRRQCRRRHRLSVTEMVSYARRGLEFFCPIPVPC